MIEREILQTLQEAVTAAVDASTEPDLPVKYVKRTFTVPSDQRYLEIVHIPNNPDQGFWNEEKRYAGVLRLILHWDLQDSAPYEAMDLIASIASYFTKDLRLGKVKVADVPNLLSVLEAPPEIMLPVSIRYTAFEA